MVTKPRPKRNAEAFLRNRQAENSSDSKRPRFDPRNPAALAADAPEEDEILDIDEIGRRGPQTKRNAVNIDGFESDSSNEGFGARADARAKLAEQEARKSGSKDEDMDDIFGDLDEEAAREEGEVEANGGHGGQKAKKQVKFLDVEDIEGQMADSKSGGHVHANYMGNENGMNLDSEESTDEDVPDEQRADIGGVDEELGAGAKKKHAPKLDAFHLKTENEQGGFDEHGNFVRKTQDPDAMYDTWMEGLSKADMKKAREAHAQRQKVERQKRLENDSKTMGDILGELISRMESGETILEALGRLGRGKEKKKPKWQDKRRIKKGIDMDVDTENTHKDNPAETKRKANVEAITEAADLLLSRGNTEVYEMDRELLIRTYKKESGEDWQDKIGEEDLNPRKWIYRWSDARDGGDTHGPYDGPTMLVWNDAGYFGEGVEFRRADDDNGAWHREVEF